MRSSLKVIRPIHFMVGLLVVPFAFASGTEEAATENIIPNGDFSQGNVGFTSDIPYIKPAVDCLWGGYYTIAPAFKNPQLHHLVAPELFSAAVRKTGKENVFYANAGGSEPILVWSANVKCKPKTQYMISFNCISLSGYIEDGNPPHQVATMEWVPDFEIWANRDASPSFAAGCGKYYKAKMLWNSGSSKTATIKIVRTKFAHGGGLIGISNIEMVPFKEEAKTVKAGG